jgi:hypothetical protein
VVEIGAGTYAFDVTAKGAAGTSYRIAVSLAGATSGFQVTPQDLATIHSLEGQRRGMPGYQAAHDVNHDGRIGPADLRLAKLELAQRRSVNRTPLRDGLETQRQLLTPMSREILGR